LGTIRLLLADDHAMFREALAHVLQHESDIAVVGVAGGGAAAVEQARQHGPDVVVLGIDFPQSDGVEAIAAIVAADPRVRIVALAGFAGQRCAEAVVSAGAEACLAKNASAAELLTAIRAVGGGRPAEAARGRGAPAARCTSRQSRSVRPPGELGRREREVLQLIAEGLRGAEIATRLRIAESTVEVHRRNIMRKLDLHGVAALTRYAIREGLCPL
jgi:two-component system NarL family response regulator